MAKFFCIVFFCLFFNLLPSHAKVHKGVIQSAIVMDAQTGNILYQKSARDLTYPASLTKIMTLMLLFDAINAKRVSFDTLLTVSKHASKQAPTKLHLKPGEKISVRNAMFALITKSANDVAVTIAEALSGSEKAFAKAMTKRARQLGMKHTTFKNASGLPDMQQQTTAQDMAIMSRALIDRYAKYYGFFKVQSFEYKGVSHRNHNNLLGKMEGIDGIKTGLTNASGFNLAASCVRDGRRLIAVVMGGKTSHSRNDLMTKLVEAAYDGDGFNALASEHPMLRQAVAQETSQEVTKVRVQPALYTPESGNWMIQVGSYPTAKQAQGGAVRHLLTIGALYDASVKVSRASTKKRLKYRAYLDGFQEKDARDACKFLTQQKASCLVIPPHRSPKIYTAMN